MQKKPSIWWVVFVGAVKLLVNSQYKWKSITKQTALAILGLIGVATPVAIHRTVTIYSVGEDGVPKEFWYHWPVYVYAIMTIGVVLVIWFAFCLVWSWFTTPRIAVRRKADFPRLGVTNVQIEVTNLSSQTIENCGAKIYPSPSMGNYDAIPVPLNCSSYLHPDNESRAITELAPLVFDVFTIDDYTGKLCIAGCHDHTKHEIDNIAYSVCIVVSGKDIPDKEYIFKYDPPPLLPRPPRPLPQTADLGQSEFDKLPKDTFG